MNFETIGSNLAEAAEELLKLQQKAADGLLSEEDFQVRLLHAYHHLNWTWNTRHKTPEELTGFTQEDFHEWGRYPVEIEEL